MLFRSVGGGFGSKSGFGCYPEDVVLAWASRRTGRPLRWTESRSEAMLAMGHGRAGTHHVRIGASKDGKVLRVPIPPLTEERRKELSKHVHKQAEEGRNAVRQVRRDANDRLKKLLKEHKISEDDERKGLDQVQKITDEHVRLIDDLQKKKDQELLGH